MKAKDLIAYGILAVAGSTMTNAYEADWFPGKILVDGRLRYESADQTGLQQSDAVTYRLRLGYEVPISEWATFLAEGEGTLDFQFAEYDAYPGAQGEPGHTVIADPQNLELNRLQLSLDMDPVGAVIGRQRIIRNNARFIGNVGWRQNEQTFDAIGITYTPLKELNLYYAYLDAANRIFGIRADASVQRQFELKSHVLEAQYDFANGMKAGAYGYLIGIENSAGDSSDTFGIWFTSVQSLNQDGLSMDWRAEYAKQTENSHSPANADFSLGYYHMTIGLTQKGLGNLTLGYEVLEGDGSRGFSTPLATLHAFNGFADLFLATPANGLADIYVKAGIPVSANVSAALVYHEFQADHGSASYGKEIDAVCSWKINDSMSATAKAAFFDGKTLPDVTKFWLQLDMKY